VKSSINASPLSGSSAKTGDKPSQRHRRNHARRQTARSF
jgi:hypothetical protein